MKKFNRKEILCLEDGKISKPYDKIGDFVDGFAIVLSNGMYGFIDEELNEIVVPQFEEVHNFKNGYAIVRSERGWGAIDQTGKVVVDNQFFNLGDFNSCGLAPFKFAGRYGAVDSTGKVVVKPIYECKISFHEGFACIRRDCRWGFINEAFEEVISPIYDLAGDFQCGRALVLVSKDHQRFINTKCEFINI